MQVVVLYDQKASYSARAELDYEPVFQELDNVHSIADGIRSTGRDVRVCKWEDRSMDSCLNELTGSFVVNLCMGLHGDMKMSLVPMLLEQKGIPYFGNDAKAHLICNDKSLTKLRIAEQGIQTPAALVITKETRDLAAAWAEHHGFPVILKPTNSLFSTGLTLAHTSNELSDAITTTLPQHGALLLEQYITGVEYQVAVFGPYAGVITLRLTDGSTVFSHWHKSDSSRYTYQPEVPGDLKESLISLCRRAFRALEMKDVGRFDLKVDAKGTPWIIEANSSPSIAWGLSALGIALEASGVKKDDFYAAIA